MLSKLRCTRTRARSLAFVLAIATAPLRANDLALETLLTDLEEPVLVVAAPEETSRLFVLERLGRVRVVVDGTLLATPFLDLTGAVATSTEQGLLGLAFHPDYASNGRLFVSFTDPNGDSQIVEYARSSNANLALPSPVATIFSAAQPEAEHNGGCLRFSPGGLLYLSLGDGGGVNDPAGRSQDTSSPLGKLLRFDVDRPFPHVPPKNPFVGGPGLDAIYALGLRNAWRFSFDPDSGDLWIGDVGQAQVEEIDLLPADAATPGAANFGWRCLEGERCTGLTGCACDDPALVAPLVTFAHTDGCAVVGGHVYRGQDLAGYAGTYFYGDYCTGRVFSLRRESTGELVGFRERTQELEASLGRALGPISSFGEDASGELYVLERSGSVHRLRLAGPEPQSYCTALPNSTGLPSRISHVGSTSLAANDLELRLERLPREPQITGIFVASPDPDQTPLGNGNLCLGQQSLGFIVRLLPSFVPDAFGRAGLQLDTTLQPLPGGPRPGDTWYFQGWHRDVTGFGFNLSDGLQVVFGL